MILLSAGAVYAQNTKGDKPAAANKDNRFKKPFKKNIPKARPASGKRVRAKEFSTASRASSGSWGRRASGKERPGKPVRPLTAQRPQSKQRAWSGDIAGRRIRTSSPAREGRRNVYPQYGRYSRGSPPPKKNEHAVSNKGTLARAKRLSSHPSPPGKKRKVVPRSSSGSFIARKSINVYANFPRPKRRGEHAVVNDLAGRPLRKKNFETPRPGVTAPLFKPYYHRGPMGDKPYKGSMPFGYKSATRNPTAWQGDITGRRLRGRNFTSKKTTEGRPIMPSGNNRSATRSHPGERPIDARVPGIGANGINGIKGNLKTRRPLKGGGSISGRLWNNNQRPLDARMPGQGAKVALFQGSIKAYKPLKGGGSISGRLWNNNQQPLSVQRPSQGARAGYYQGNIKVAKSQRVTPDVKGSLPRKALSPSARKVGGYPGKWKRFEVQPGFGYMGELERGDIKLRKFGRSYAQHPNAAEESTKKLRLKKSAFKVEGLTSKMKRPDYIENKLASDDALMKKKPSKSDAKAGNLQVKIKRPDYIKNDNSADESLMKLRPSKANALAGNLQVKVKQPPYGTKPHAVEGSLPGFKPSSSTVKASEYARGVKRNWDYVRNPSSSQDALKVREPGKAFAKVTAYQGNIKMHKYELFERNRSLHPDSKFVKTNKNNVDGERDVVTNFKLWWSRLFKKEETQPEGLKYKGKKPRYDKGEAGLWYE